MALNKAQTSMGTKIVLILLIVAFLMSFISIGAGLFGGNAGTGTQTATDPISVANQKYQPAVAALTSQLQSEPESYTVLVSLGNTYYDWANELTQASQNNTAAAGNAALSWNAARDNYAKALKVQDDDPNVSTDYAITLYYTGDTNAAITEVNRVIKENPTFAPAYFNLGVFNQALGKNAEAYAAFKKTVDLDAQGQQTNVAYAKQQVEALKSFASPGTATTATP